MMVYTHSVVRDLDLEGPAGAFDLQRAEREAIASRRGPDRLLGILAAKSVVIEACRQSQIDAGPAEVSIDHLPTGRPIALLGNRHTDVVSSTLATFPLFLTISHERRIGVAACIAQPWRARAVLTAGIDVVDRRRLERPRPAAEWEVLRRRILAEEEVAAGVGLATESLTAVLAVKEAVAKATRWRWPHVRWHDVVTMPGRSTIAGLLTIAWRIVGESDAGSGGRAHVREDGPYLTAQLAVEVNRR